MGSYQETDCMRLEISDSIEAIVTDESGKTETYLGTIVGGHRVSGTIRRGESTLILDPKDRNLRYIPRNRRPKKGHPLSPDLYTKTIPMPPVRSYLTQTSIQVFYVPTEEIHIPNTKSTVIIRRVSPEAVKRN